MIATYQHFYLLSISCKLNSFSHITISHSILFPTHITDLYDPFGFNKNMSAETKEKRLTAELNNGRLAQLGIFGFLCADKIPGSVPLLNDIAIHYDGNPMVPFEGQFSYFS